MSQCILDVLDRPLVPEPRRIEPRSGTCVLSLPLRVEGAGEAEQFAAGQLDQRLRTAFPECAKAGPGTRLRFAREAKLPTEGYRLTVATDSITIESSTPAGDYYGAQTVEQLLARQGDQVVAPCCAIEDHPALKYRAIHYDTKHHQPTAAYVEDFIRTLAHYKVNVLVWEWEDKFAYESHPEVGAPGAFTKEQMRAFTALARRHHIQLVPLVQGLGHVSYILKHPQHAHLREIPASNWEFCPLKEGSYQLLFDLWQDAIDATPGSEFIHLGSDETYELGEGQACGCKAKADQIGKAGLMQLFLHKCVPFLESKGRRVLSWGGGWKPGTPHPPLPSMIYTDGADADRLRDAKAAGYQGWVYAPNPGIEPLFLPHLPTMIHSMWQTQGGRAHPGLFRQTALPLARAAREGATEGSITTSWDDSGLHDCGWMFRFLTAAEFSWNPADREMDRWIQRLMDNYFGPTARDVRELFYLLQEGAMFYYDTFERRVWHWGAIGKIHLPDFPRGGLEISNYWRIRYAHLLPLANKQRLDLARALAIIADNLARDVRHRHDMEVYASIARLMDHNAALILMLGDLEHQVCLASAAHYSDTAQAAHHLRNATAPIEDHLRERNEVFQGLVTLWNQTRLEKGLSTPEKPYVFARDRARHFANRTPNMSYLIMDEQQLDLETYLARLQAYTREYEAEYLTARPPAGA